MYEDKDDDGDYGQLQLLPSSSFALQYKRERDQESILQCIREVWPRPCFQWCKGRLNCTAQVRRSQEQQDGQELSGAYLNSRVLRQEQLYINELFEQA